MLPPIIVTLLMVFSELYNCSEHEFCNLFS